MSTHEHSLALLAWPSSRRSSLASLVSQPLEAPSSAPRTPAIIAACSRGSRGLRPALLTALLTALLQAERKNEREESLSTLISMHRQCEL